MNTNPKYNIAFFTFIALCSFIQIRSTTPNELYDITSKVLKKEIEKNYKKHNEGRNRLSKSNQEKMKNAIIETNADLKEALRITGFDTINFNINDTFCYFEQVHTFAKKGSFYSILFYNQEIKWAVRDSLNAEMVVVDDRHDMMKPYYDFKKGNIDSIFSNYLSPNHVIGVRVIRKSVGKYETLVHDWQG